MSGDASAGSDAPSETLLAGGLANAGAVVRRGVAVRRPAPADAPVLHGFLRGLREAGFAGAPLPRRLSDEGWEELEFIHGDVPLRPYPWWALGDGALASVGRVLRRYHEAAARVETDPAAPWCTELADPEGGPVVCHNDVCHSNVVFRDHVAAALIDFDFAAPGRPVWDVVMTARYWAPLADATSASVSGLDHLDPFRRVGVLVDAYGLGAADRTAFPDVFDQVTGVCRAFVSARVGAGDERFVAALQEHGGWERWDRLERWIAASRGRLAEAVRG